MGSDPGNAAKKLGMGRDLIKSLEKPLELAVSQYIRSMPFLWIGINDGPDSENKRSYIEQNAIALLSNWNKNSIDGPSEQWLGRNSTRERVRLSGLWNNNHVDGNYEPDFISRLFSYVRRIAH